MGLRMIIILSIIILAEYYSFTLINSLVRNLPGVWRISLITIYVALTILIWGGILFFRKIFWHGMPSFFRNVYIALVLGVFIGKILIMAVLMIDDVRRLFTWLVSLFVTGSDTVSGKTAFNMSRSVFFKRTAIFLGGLSVTGFLYGMSNRYNYKVKKVKVKLSNLPEAFNGFKIVQISDIHTGSFDDYDAVAKGISLAMDQKPDLLVFTGDLVNSRADEVDEKYQEIFSKLKAPMGVFSTLGNHDYGDYVHWPNPQAKKDNLEKLKSIQASMGWKLLMNEHVILEKGNDKIGLIGIENWSAKSNFSRYGDMRKAYDGLAEKNVPVKILLSHDPSQWDAQVRTEYKDVDLTLSGHTHGMQMGVDTKWLKWSPVQYMYKEWAGIYQGDNQYLYVNRGFGFLGYAGRLGIMPEITVIELV